jgi:hypothetical protein
MISAKPLQERDRLAGEEAVTASINVDWRAANPPVGAGLPAKTVAQATMMLDVTAPSLASQLLQIGGEAGR